MGEFAESTYRVRVGLGIAAASSRPRHQNKAIDKSLTSTLSPTKASEPQMSPGSPEGFRTGAPMHSREYDFPASDFHRGSSSREAAEGFSAIEAALDDGIGETGANGGGIMDLIAIMLGWGVLVAVILYPALQLGAFATCIVFFCTRSFLRIVFGQAPTSVEWPSEMPPRHQSFLRA